MLETIGGAFSTVLNITMYAVPTSIILTWAFK